MAATKYGCKPSRQTNECNARKSRILCSKKELRILRKRSVTKGRPTVVFFMKYFYLVVAYRMIHNHMSHNQAKKWALSLIYRVALDFEKSKKKFSKRPLMTFLKNNRYNWSKNIILQHLTGSKTFSQFPEIFLVIIHIQTIYHGMSYVLVPKKFFGRNSQFSSAYFLFWIMRIQNIHIMWGLVQR